jgi:Ca2+-binding RTX toxin-like protein
LSGRVEGSNLDATAEAGEPQHAGVPGGRSVWYRWTAPATGQVSFVTLGSTFDTLLGVYTGDAVTSLTEVAGNDDWVAGTSVSALSFPAVAGTVYSVAVDGFGGKVGSLNLAWRPAPANDNLADAQAIAGGAGAVSGTTVGATKEAGEPAHAGIPGGRSIWYMWTAPSSRRVQFNTLGSRGDTLLAVYTGTDFDALRRVASNDDFFNAVVFSCCPSQVSFVAVAGTAYLIAIDTFAFPAEQEGAPPGPTVLRWSPLVLGTAGNDVLTGTSGAEEIRGLGGNDTIRAGGGNDTVLGGRGSDLLLGGAGNDRVGDLSGIDRLHGGFGSDLLNARDFARRGDTVAGGPDQDRCMTDGADRRTGCP